MLWDTELRRPCHAIFNISGLDRMSCIPPTLRDRVHRELPPVGTVTASERLTINGKILPVVFNTTLVSDLSQALKSHKDSSLPAYARLKRMF